MALSFSLKTVLVTVKRHTIPKCKNNVFIKWEFCNSVQITNFIRSAGTNPAQSVLNQSKIKRFQTCKHATKLHIPTHTKGGLRGTNKCFKTVDIQYKHVKRNHPLYISIQTTHLQIQKPEMKLVCMLETCTTYIFSSSQLWGWKYLPWSVPDQGITRGFL